MRMKKMMRISNDGDAGFRLRSSSYDPTSKAPRYSLRHCIRDTTLGFRASSKTVRAVAALPADVIESFNNGTLASPLFYR